MVHTVPDDMSPGSDIANLAVLGYDPRKYYSGRSPLEALSIGVEMKDTDVALRCNIVTLSEEDVPFEERIIIDHSSDEISTEDAAVLLKEVMKELANETFQFYVGTSYRHCMIWNHGRVVTLTAPHDVLGSVIGQYLPGEQMLLDMMKRSYEILNNHPVNIARAERGLKKANTIWIWGEGKKPLLSDFYEKYGMKGTVISAVDLIKGIGLCAGLDVVDVEGATGNVHTNYKGKADAALDALKNGSDYVYVHLEGPDECGHRHEIENKVKAIELIDEKVVKYIKDDLDKNGIDYRMLILPDHPTPLALRTHTRDSVPYIIYDSTAKADATAESYTEEEARKSGILIEEGYKLMEKFV
jgi:2,3-bisphosphoglycerate-independent phosphoglycerate mutase